MRRFLEKAIPIYTSTIIMGFIPSFLSNILPVKFSIIVIIVALVMSVILYMFAKRFPSLLGEKNCYAATGIVFDKTYTYILLAYHEKQKRWIPPGSHIKGTLYFHEEVLKSAKRETGHHVEFVELNDYQDYKDDNCRVVPQPYSVQIETQIPHEGHDEHYDLLYILIADKDENIERPGTHKIKWVTYEQLKQEAKKGNTYQDVVQSVETALEYIKKRGEKGEDK